MTSEAEKKDPHEIDEKDPRLPGLMAGLRRYLTVVNNPIATAEERSTAIKTLGENFSTLGIKQLGTLEPDEKGDFKIWVKKEDGTREPINIPAAAASVITASADALYAGASARLKFEALKQGVALGHQALKNLGTIEGIAEATLASGDRLWGGKPHSNRHPGTEPT